MRSLCRAIEDAGEGIPTLADLAAQVGGSPHHLQRVFKRVMGISPRRYGGVFARWAFAGDRPAYGIDKTPSPLPFRLLS